ncbi:MAG: HEAT repeat domain-containing protein [Phycisphaerae bacterium]|nr:HEAT repeat domain-containing protein [Phycisphaerae bacterium]
MRTEPDIRLDADHLRVVACGASVNRGEANRAGRPRGAASRGLRGRSTVFILTTALSLLIGARPGFADTSDEQLKFAKERPFDIEHIKLDLYLELPQKFVRSRATIKGHALRPLERITLDAVGFNDVSVAARFSGESSAPAVFENDGERITVELKRSLEAGESLDLFIDYTLDDPKSGLHFFAPSEEEPETPYLVWSQGQSIDNRHWIPCFDHPNEMQTSEVVCTVAEPYQVISNGKLERVTENSDGTRTFHWSQTKPHVSYLITLVAGEFATRTDTWRDIPVAYHANPKHEEKLERSFRNTPAMLEFFSNQIGVKFPWAKYDQVCCHGFGGGMENTSATTLGERALYDDRRILDDDPDGLISHELAHQWFGDLLTCRDWAHIWLNEGFASYFEALWDEHHSGPEEFSYNMRNKARGAINGGREHPVVWRGYTSPDEQFDSRAYPKGAWVVHMIRRRLGDGLFWQVIKTYVERFSHRSVDTEDLRKTIEEVTGRSFERFFLDWTGRAGSPEVKVAYRWLEQDRMAKLTVEQTQKEDPFHFPLVFEFGFGGDETPYRMTHEVTERQSTFYVPLKRQPKQVRIDPEQAVLMTLAREQPRNIWISQLEDANPSARLDAVEHFADAGGRANMKLLIRRLSVDSFWAVRADIAERLGKEGSESSRDALLANIGTDHPRVRAAVVEALGQFAGDEKVAAALAALVERGDPSYRVETAAIRGYAAVHDGDSAAIIRVAMDRDSDRDVIRAAALEAMGSNGGTDAFGALKAWSLPEKPMTCRAAAIRALAQLASRDVLDEHAVDEVVSLVEKAIKSTPMELRRAGYAACGTLGPRAAGLAATIEEAMKGGPRRLRRMGEETLKRIRGEQKPDKQLAELREKLEQLTQEYKLMSATISKLKSSKGSSEAETEPRSGKEQTSDSAPAAEPSSGVLAN